jgi:nicotinate-nucleotide adenylyltransferase
MSFDVTGSQNMTKLWFGGSFNPLHIGHLLIARAVAEAKGYAKVVLVPSAQPPHKPLAADLAAAADRLEMCQAVARSDSLFEVAGLELDRRGPSYTYDTVQELRRAGVVEIPWLIGADMLFNLPTWHRIAELIHEITFVVVSRPGFEINWSALNPQFQHLKSNVVTAPLLQISASDVRRRIQQGLDIRYLVPPAVEECIRARGLYRS